MFVTALLMGSAALQIFTPGQLMAESEPGARSARAVAAALNGALGTSSNPHATLDTFAQSLGASEAIQFRRRGATPDVRAPAAAPAPPAGVPAWFVALLAIPEIGAIHPVTIAGEQVGDIVFAPDLSADIHEKWIGFLAIAFAATTLMLLTGAITCFTAATVLRPLQDLGDGLTRMRSGDYEHLIPITGPPEIRRGSQEANELARTFNRLSQDNRSLLRRMVSLQDDERRDMARELHDELGPLLFGIRANTIALLETTPPDRPELGSAAEGILQSVETLQQANRRILDRLRPLYIQELGLERSIQTLLQNAKAQAPDLRITSQIDVALNEIDGLLSQTVYRVIQEAVTNVLRHAQAGAMHVSARIVGRELTVEVSDDGIGFAPERTFGRGLTGMLERVRALSGTLQVLRDGGRTSVRCQLPTGDGGLEAKAGTKKS
jgi:two-component system sensor histidine kinase UhpB